MTGETTQPAQPGRVARWRTAYVLLRELAAGEQITYQRLGEVLGLDPVTDRNRIAPVVRRANDELQRVDHRAVDCVTGVGYVVVTPEEQLVLARRQVTRAGAAIDRGHSLASNVNLNGVNPQVRNALELLARGFAAQADFNRRMLGHQANLADALQRIEQHNARTDNEVDVLRRRLDALEGHGTPNTEQ